MNPVEIEEAISALAEQAFDREEFPYAFLEAFGNKPTTIKKLRSGVTNRSDCGGVLQTSNIHLLVAEAGRVTESLNLLRESPATKKAKAKFILATDGVDFEAEDLGSGEIVACAYPEFPDHFGFFLPLAGISTVKQISDNPIDIRATSRLNRLYVELLKDNPEWGGDERRADMNKFMARLIFCFFAEDTGIFMKQKSFTETVKTMSAADSSNTHEIITALFRAMNTDLGERDAAGTPRWARDFPYVNGRLFSGSDEVPVFSKIARSYLIHVGGLDWAKINPDIFGSMIQAIADDDERGALGMHYTSVPNILKVLNPLFLDDLRAKLEEAGDSKRKLDNLRKRMARIRVFDPACGSGNFLVIAYKEMRAIEAEINRRRGEETRASEIALTNFRGIELRDFPAEIARLALIIAEYQCDVLYRGHQLALAEFLPLKNENWIVCGNALRLDWLKICPPAGKAVSVHAEDLFSQPVDQAEVDFENEGGETYICGNPPYLGSTYQTKSQKEDLEAIFGGRVRNWKSLDYVAGWFMKAADYGKYNESTAAFVSTNSICQGQQVPILWPAIFETGCQIVFAHTSFKWANLASHNAGVTVAIIAISRNIPSVRKLYSEINGEVIAKEAVNINAYLIDGTNTVVTRLSNPQSGQHEMYFGNKPVDGQNLLVYASDLELLDLTPSQEKRLIRRIYGSQEFIRGLSRYCLWIEDDYLPEALLNPKVRQRIENVRIFRSQSTDIGARNMASRAHQMREMRISRAHTIVVPRTTSENRDYLPCGLIDSWSTVTSEAFALYDAPFWNMALIPGRLHLVWVATVCGKLETRYRYSNTLGWNTFPVPKLTEKNRADLTRCAEDILLTRERHFPKTIADLYDPEKMPADLREAHDRNDEVLERIYIGRLFKNDTERLEKLFELYTKMTAEEAEKAPAPSGAKKKAQKRSEA